MPMSGTENPKSCNTSSVDCRHGKDTGRSWLSRSRRPWHQRGKFAFVGSLNRVVDGILKPLRRRCRGFIAGVFASVFRDAENHDTVCKRCLPLAAVMLPGAHGERLPR